MAKLRVADDCPVNQEFLSALLKLSLALAGESDPGRLIGLACRGAGDILSLPHAAIVLRDEDGRIHRLECAGMAADTTAFVGTRQPDPGFLAACHGPAEAILVQGIHTPNRYYGWLYLAGRRPGMAAATEVEQTVAHLAAQFALAWENLQNLNLVARLEAARREAEAANEAKTRFLAAVSHDLRQPLYGMRLLHTMLTRKPDDPVEVRNTCARMGDVLNSTEAMLNRLLEYSTLASGQIEVERKVFEVDKLVRQIAVSHLAEAVAKGLDLRVRTFPCAADSDPLLVERILRNFMANAIRYTERGGILLAVRRRRGQLRIEVHDTGPGIPADKHAIIFEEFHQLGNDTRERCQGVGLGLAIAACTARQLEHPLELRSSVGKGSMFAFSLPEAALAVQAPPRPEAHAAAVEGAMILMVEDDAMQAEATECLLAYNGYRVTVARCGAETLAILERGEVVPDAILADYSLPGGVDGIDLIKRVRMLVGGPIPAILLTGHVQTQIADSALGEGIQVLHKPCDPVQMLDSIAASLNGGTRGNRGDYPRR